ncbi:MAG: hypothetical protein ACW99J_16150 [Candidatus Thorarchaeota archaeon]|jgi:hypothetical protein
MEMRVFYLTPGQQAPKDTTSKALRDGGIVWIGEPGTFPSMSNTGVPYINRLFTLLDHDEWDALQEYGVFDQPREITFDEFLDKNKLSAKKSEYAELITRLDDTIKAI